MIEQQHTDWTFDEFHAFTMLYAANTDGAITADEDNLIHPLLSESAYAHIRSVFSACDDVEALNIILSYRDKYCATQEQKDQILADMQAIYRANDDYEQIEQAVHQLFKRML